MDDSGKSTSSSLRLECGQVMHLQQMDQTESSRQQVKLIGWETGKSLIVKPHSLSSWILIPSKKSFLVRLFSGSSAYGFETSIICIHDKPYGYFHMVYPKGFNSSQVRKHPRVKVDMEAMIKTKDNEVMAVKLLDISRSGLGFLGPKNLAKVGSQLKIKFEFSANEKEHSFSEIIIVRNTRPLGGNKTESIFGVEFLQLNSEKTLTLAGFLYEQNV